MLISAEEYLSLTDELALANFKARNLENDNRKLNQLVVQQQQTINMLNIRLDEQMNKNKQIDLEILRHVDQNSSNVEATVTAAAQEQIKFMEQELAKIKSDANVQKIRQLQKKMTQNRFVSHQMIDFYQKIQTLYMVLNNTKVVPSMPELYKWATLRKNQELRASAVKYNPTGMTQKSILGGSKISIMKGSNINTSQIKNGLNKSQLQTNSNMSFSKMGNTNGKFKNQKAMGQTFSDTNEKIFEIMNSKQKVPKIGKTRSAQKNGGVEKKGKKEKKEKGTKKELKIASTQSLTQKLEVDEMPPFEKGPRLMNKESIVHVDVDC